MTSSVFLATIAVVIEFITMALYIRDICRGQVKPHAFTWIIWTLLQSIATAAILFEEAWIGGISLLVCLPVYFTIFLLSLKRGDKNISRKDWITFILTLSAIPLWQMTKNPIFAVVLVSLIDAAGTSFTFRKVWRNPFEEQALLFIAYALTGLLRLTVMDPFNFVTAFYPSTVFFLDTAMAVLIVLRRLFLSRQKASSSEPAV